MRVIDRPQRIGLRRIHLILLLALFAIGAAVIGISLQTHPQISRHVLVLNTHEPMNVLVTVRGTPLNPGFLGFVAVIRSDTHVLNVIPVSGLTMVKVKHSEEPLYQAISNAPAHDDGHLVSMATGVPIDHYFSLTNDDLMLVLDALYYHSPNWPNTRTPLTMLATLGYPSGTIKPVEEMKLMGTIVNHIPLITPLAASRLLGITVNSKTNLTTYQLFLLANYVRGDTLHAQSATQYQHRRSSHG